METISTAELIELISILSSAMDSQFQYWLAVSFALIIAGYMVGDKMSKRVRFVLTLLYILVTIVFLGRWAFTAVNIGMLTNELLARDVSWLRMGGTLWITRVMVMLGGTVASVWFFYIGYKIGDVQK